MQERQARAEAEQRFSVALGEVGGRADAAVATASAGEPYTPVSVSSSSMMGCIDTRLLGKPDKFDGQDSCWRDWKFITKAYMQAALPDIRTLLVKAEETSLWLLCCVLVVVVVRTRCTTCVSLHTRRRCMHQIGAEHLGASSRHPRHPFPALMAGVNPGRVPVYTALKRSLMSSS